MFEDGVSGVQAARAAGMEGSFPSLLLSGHEPLLSLITPTCCSRLDSGSGTRQDARQPARPEPFSSALVDGGFRPGSLGLAALRFLITVVRGYNRRAVLGN